MEKEVKVFNPISGYGSINHAQVLVCNLEKEFSTLGMNFDFEKAKSELDSRWRKWNDDYKEIVQYLSKFWGRYVHIRFTYNANYGEDRETNPQWQSVYEANVLLYRFIKGNDSLFGIFSRIDNNYNGSVEDTSIDLTDYVEKYRMEINEITEEEFVNGAQESITNVLKARISKIESPDYKLSENGYEHKNLFGNWWESWSPCETSR